MSRFRLFIAFVLTFSLLTACSYSNRTAVKAVVTKDEERLVEAVLKALNEKSWEMIVPYVTHDISQTGFSDLSRKLESEAKEDFPALPVKAEPFAKSISITNGIQKTALRYELTFANGNRSVLNIFLINGEEGPKVYSFHFQNVERLEKAFAFFGGPRGVLQYFFVLLAIVTQAMAIVAAASVLMLRPKRWLLWLLFVSSGICVFELNWATNHIQIDPFRMLALAGYISKKGMEYVPWSVAFSIPVGALIFLMKFRTLLRTKIRTLISR